MSSKTEERTSRGFSCLKNSGRLALAFRLKKFLHHPKDHNAQQLTILRFFHNFEKAANIL